LCHNPKDHDLTRHSHENLKSRTVNKVKGKSRKRRNKYTSNTHRNGLNKKLSVKLEERRGQKAKRLDS